MFSVVRAGIGTDEECAGADGVDPGASLGILGVSGMNGGLSAEAGNDKGPLLEAGCMIESLLENRLRSEGDEAGALSTETVAGAGCVWHELESGCGRGVSPSEMRLGSEGDEAGASATGVVAGAGCVRL